MITNPDAKWFRINGRDGGFRTLREQLLGLEVLSGPQIAGKSVLDLGCAEGLIGLHLLERGAARLVGMSIEQAEIDEACRRRGSDERAQFICADLGRPEVLVGVVPFDVVLMLSIAHKMHDPRAFVVRAAGIAREVIMLRLPSREFRQQRLHKVEMRPVTWLAECGWKLTAEPRTCREEWMGEFRPA